MTLNVRIFKLVGGLVCLSTAAILLAVWLTMTEHLRTQVTKDLEVGQGVIEQFFKSREGILFNSADVLTADFGFKQAVATNDRATMESALVNHSQRIASDLMAVLSLDGITIASSTGKLKAGQQFPEPLLIERTLRDGGAISTFTEGGSIYQIILLTVNVPNPIAIAIVGFEIDASLLEELKSITKLEISMQAGALDQAVIVSSLAGAERKAALEADLHTIYELSPLFYDAEQFVSRRFLMNADEQSTVTVALSEQLGYWFSGFNRLLIEITFIAFLSIGLALLLGLVFSRNLSRPLANLARLAERISIGDYREAEYSEAKSKEINELAHALFGMQNDIQEREAEIQYQAKHDLLTKLYNRYEISEILSQKLAAEESFQAISFKLIGFREINNAFGYGCGDACLNSLAERVRGLKGIAARLNGSEILWIPEVAPSQSKLMEIRDSLEAPHVVDDIEIKTQLSVGLIELPDDADNTESLFRHLSIAVEQSQQNASHYQAYQRGMEQDYLKRLAILRELENALNDDNGELTMFYQPKLDLRTGRVTKVEALIRWTNKSLGFVPPDLFIPIAEKAGSISEITSWVFRRVVRDLQDWQSRGLTLNAAINLSVHDVTHKPLMKAVETLLADANISHSRVEFEITESDLMDEPTKTIEQLQKLRETGFALAIDDFGTGYSSLAYLKNMPVSELKIDKSFVLKLDQDEDDQTIVKTIIDLAKRFNLKVVAEGVETQSALTLLSSWGCDWIQGYYISKPMDPDALIEWLETHEHHSWTEETA